MVKLAIHVGASLLKRQVSLKIIGNVPLDDLANYEVKNTVEIQYLAYLCY